MKKLLLAFVVIALVSCTGDEADYGETVALADYVQEEAAREDTLAEDTLAEPATQEVDRGRVSRSTTTEPDERYFPWRNIARVSASSELDGQYGVENLFDRAWRPWGTGAEGGGVGEYFTVEFAQPVRLRHFWLRNGHGRMDYFFRANRVKTFEILFDDDTSGPLIAIEDDFRQMVYNLPGVDHWNDFIEVTRITFVIRDVHPGTEFDAAFVSEIVFAAPPFWWAANNPFEPGNLEAFAADSHTVKLVRAMYEFYGISTRLDSDNQLEILLNPFWDIDDMRWHNISVGLSGRVLHLHFIGGGGSSAEEYKIFLSPVFPPILITYNAGHDGVFLRYRLTNIKLFNGETWEDHDNELGLLPILALKEDIEARGLFGRFSFGSSDFDNSFSLIVTAHYRGASGDDSFLDNSLQETHNFLWNGEEFVLQ